MNQPGTVTENEKRPGCWRGVTAILIFAWVIFFFLITASPHSWPFGGPFRNPEQKRTQTILSTLKLGIEFEVANKGSIVLRFDTLCTAFSNSSAYNDLKELKAIDLEKKCFVDAWGRPISIQQDSKGTVTTISAGSDGIPDTKDDIH